MIYYNFDFQMEWIFNLAVHTGSDQNTRIRPNSDFEPLILFQIKTKKKHEIFKEDTLLCLVTFFALSVSV